MRVTEVDKLFPLPWAHETDGKQMTAVYAANGNLVCGSAVCQHSKDSAAAYRQAHAVIVDAVNKWRKQ